MTSTAFSATNVQITAKLADGTFRKYYFAASDLLGEHHTGDLDKGREFVASGQKAVLAGAVQYLVLEVRSENDAWWRREVKVFGRKNGWKIKTRTALSKAAQNDTAEFDGIADAEARAESQGEGCGCNERDCADCGFSPVPTVAFSAA